MPQKCQELTSRAVLIRRPDSSSALSLLARKRQDAVETVHGVAVRHALEDVIEFCGGDERTGGGPPSAATVGAELIMPGF